VIAWLLGLLLLAGPLAPASAQDPSLRPVPALSGRVVDQAGVLQPAERERIEAALAVLEQRKGAQIAVLTVPAIAPEPVASYALRVVEAWRLGRGQTGAAQAVDDGVLLLVVRDERKLRIEVGRGLGGAIPDALAKRIIAETIAPRLREGAFGAGIEAGVTDLIRLIDGEPLPAPWHPAEAPADDTDWLALIAFAVLFGLAAARRIGRRPASLLSGLGGGVLAFSHGQGLMVALPVAVGVAMIVLVLAALGGGPGRTGGHGRVWTGDGGPGGWRGGRGGGGSSGGGFSGGGGSFGGGGASGDW
jgi:uncharacterized protein